MPKEACGIISELFRSSLAPCSISTRVLCTHQLWQKAKRSVPMGCSDKGLSMASGVNFFTNGYQNIRGHRSKLTNPPP